MTAKKDCLHCAILAVLNKRAQEQRAADEAKFAKAGGTFIVGSMVEALMDVIAMSPTEAREELYGFLFQQVMNAGVEGGFVSEVGKPKTKHTIN